MELTFFKIRGETFSGSKKQAVYLSINNWDDYSFKTTFYLTVFDEDGNRHNIGDVKIGYVNQPHGWTETLLPSEPFGGLGEGFFSLGQSAQYYSRVCDLPIRLRRALLSGLRDVVQSNDTLVAAKEQRVFEDSLLRTINFSTISEQFKRILGGGVTLTPFYFAYEAPSTEIRAGFNLIFEVQRDIKPSRNIHVLIGRNGIGKTTLLNGMITTLVDSVQNSKTTGHFFDLSDGKVVPIHKKFFSRVVSISFSAFDPFTPPTEREDTVDEIKYSYIGLKAVSEENGERKYAHKDLLSLSGDFLSSLDGCFGLTVKRQQWKEAIGFLESDSNFEDMNLCRLLEVDDQAQLQKLAQNSFMKMSSGHAIVLLTMTKLVERAEEKTLVIIDEPESHLHPPLLSAFTRALSDLLNKINGVAIIATHSPVVLQEVPKVCVWKLFRKKLESDSVRPEIETFGENVGVLTREVFGLEITKSGFYALLSQSVAELKSYDQIVSEYGGQLGFEARALLRALIANRDHSLRAS